MIIYTFLFFAFALVTVAASITVISVKNPVHAVLNLILAFFSSAGIFLLLGAEFVSMLLIIVYVGAVAVLFLFVVMMMDINFAELKQGFIRHLPLGLLVGGVLAADILLAITAPESAPKKMAAPLVHYNFSNSLSNTQALGTVLYTEFVLPFQLASLVLLMAMIGAIVLTLRSRMGVKKQNIAEQVNRHKSQSIELVKVKPNQGIMDGKIR